MKTSSKITRGFMVLAALALPALSWWGSWRYQAAKEAEAARIEAEQKQIEEKQRVERWLQQQTVRDVFAEWKKSSDEISKRLAELEKVRESVEKSENKAGPPSLEAIKRQLAELKVEQEDLRRKQVAGSLEVSPVIKRTSWNGQTDPDSVWHDQRTRANQTLIEHGLPTLDGRGYFPDSAPLTRTFPGVKRQK